MKPYLPLTVEYALLGFLYQQPRHGYEIHQQLLSSAGVGLIWRVKQSQVYTLLNKLEQNGYVTAVTETGDAYPPRKILHLTPSGETAFFNWLQTPVPQAHKVRQEFMAKLYFAVQIGTPAAMTLITSQRQKCQAWLALSEEQAATFSAEQRFEWLLYQFRRGQIEAMLQWLDRCEQALSAPVPL
ncbi:MAG: PadR family transcriptional regulator [Chloroflexi bacterium]|nr:PadR family transcriptional regulator [Ardenticatenaceae bacterium]MBL1129408.1 PadR family transcriptional regulator [Chloroflexota bacterium]NOG35488.1 PadR family transcriptional regulator [Chloroflexota bacterium]GIK57437.1 MAG: PadR family transcriptional regulator [Chloroflexota bacterium]